MDINKTALSIERAVFEATGSWLRDVVVIPSPDKSFRADLKN
jgi:hypothetical protein